MRLQHNCKQVVPLLGVLPLNKIEKYLNYPPPRGEQIESNNSFLLVNILHVHKIFVQNKSERRKQKKIYIYFLTYGQMRLESRICIEQNLTQLNK